MTAANLFQIGSGWFPEQKGGAENVFYNLYQGLGREGFAVRGVVPGSDAVGTTTAGMMQGFPARGVSLAGRALAIRRSARSSFRSNRPDIVGSHFALYSLLLLGSLPDVPMVTHFHGPWAMESSVEGASRSAIWAKKAIEGFVYRRAVRIIVLSTTFGELLQKHYGVPAHLIRTVPGGVECDRFAVPESRAAARAALGWEADRPIVLAVRRLVRRMGLDRLIEAMALLRRGSAHGGRDVVLHIAGTGPERAALEAQAAGLGLADVVRFDGFVPDDRLPLAYRAADVTLIPTAELEGFGLVAVESLAAGTPVLATPVGGLPELVAGLSRAMILDGTAPQNIADGIASALADASFLPDAAACRCYARDKFDWTIVIPQIAAVYREVM